MSELPTTQTPPKAKKLPFKPTALRKYAPRADVSVDSDQAQNGDGLELFRRSKEMQPIMEADRERRLLRKRQKLDEEQRKAVATAGKRPWETIYSDETPDLATPSATRSTDGAIRSTTPATADHGSSGEERAIELVTPPPSKLMRPSSSPAKNNANVSASEPASRPLTPSFASQAASSVVLDSPTGQPGRARHFGQTPVPIVLDDSDDDARAPTPTPRRNEGDDAAILGSSFAAADEDDEFAEYIRKAEEQRRNQALSEANQKSDEAKESIHILVTSSVPNTKPCQVKFLYSRPLRVVKNTWLALQKQKGILTDVEDKDDIVLTWRRKKVYASSTLLNLGIRPEGNGRAVADGRSTKGLAENRTQVHMEVWTRALFEEMEREEELQHKRDAGELSDGRDSPVPATDAPAPAVKLRVVLKARGLSDVKLTVRPETTVETLITGFRTQQPTASGKDVGIWFDGQRLEEHMTMDEVEVDDLDTLEVHMK